MLVAGARPVNAKTRNDAFAELIGELGPSLHSLCVGITGSSADADDALQDTLCTLATELSSFRCESRLFTWCYRIALRAAVRLRAKSRQREATTQLPQAPTARDGDSAMMERDQAKRLLLAMQQLPIEQRAVLTLFASGHTHEEIAQILDVPIGTVWSRLHAGRKGLRATLGCAVVVDATRSATSTLAASRFRSVGDAAGWYGACKTTRHVDEDDATTAGIGRARCRVRATRRERIQEPLR